MKTIHRRYVHGAEAIMFVVDAHDKDRVPEAAYELGTILQLDEATSLPVVVFANKQDLSNAMSTSDVAAIMGLEKLLSGREWKIFATCCNSGEGLNEAFEWLTPSIKNSK